MLLSSLHRSTEAPREFVGFVAGQLAELRQEAAALAESDSETDRLCTEALTDVADRWVWLELLRSRLGRARAPESYLRTALQRRAHRWTVDDLEPVEVWVTAADASPRPTSVSAAARTAVVREVAARPAATPLLEAAIAWLHAVRAHQRRRWYAIGVAVVAGLTLLSRAHRELHALPLLAG